MNRLTKIAICLTILWGAAAAAPSLAEACPNCKDTLQFNQRALGYALSIMVMMGMPFTILGGWTALIWRLRAQAKSVAADASPVGGSNSEPTDTEGRGRLSE